MESPRHPVFADVEQDAEASVAEAFARIAVEYLAATRTGEGRVSTALGPDDLARRFDEPLPAPGPSDRGRPRAAAPRRDAGLQPPLPPALDGAPGVGAAAGRGLDGVADRRAQPVRRGVGDVAGRHDPRDAGRPLDVRPGRARPRGGRHVHLRRHRGDVRRAPRGAGGGPAERVDGRASAPTRRSWSTASTRTTPSRGRSASSASAPTTRSSCRRAASAWTWRRSRRELDRLRAAGRRVMAVVATAGTTATGSFDDLEAIGRLCEARAIWLHVDGAHGASALLSPAHRFRAEGHRPGPLDRVGPAQDDADAAHGQRRARPGRARPRRGFSQRAPYLFHARGAARHLGPGRAQLPVLAPRRRAEGVGGPPAVRGGRPRRALRPPVRHRARPSRGRSRRGPTSRPCTSPSRTSSASGSSATARSTASGSTPSTCACGRSTTAPARAGSPPPCWAAGACCASPS